MEKHIYVLPGGFKYNNMQDARIHLGISSTAFRSLVKKGIIKKVVISNLNAHSNENINTTIKCCGI